MVEVPNYRVKYNGTDFDDVMYWDNNASFKSEVGTTFNLNQVTEMGFTGGAGDDIFYGSTKTKDGSANVGGNNAADSNADTPNLRDSFAIYNTSSKEYDITLNKDGGGNLTSVTIKHKVADSAGGTGTDTLYDVNKAIFNFMTDKEETINFLPETKTMKQWDPEAGKEVVTGLKIVSTPYSDTLTAASYDKNDKQDIFFENKGAGTDPNIFIGRNDASGTFGKDGVILDGTFSRYIIQYDGSNDKWLLVDSLASNKGGKGATVAKDLERVKFDDDFSLNIEKVFDGTKDSDVNTKDNLKFHNGSGMNKYDFSEFSQLSSARMAKFKISDYGNIAADTTITVQKEGLTPITFTSKTSGASGLQFNTA